MGKEAFQARLDVSRETLDRLEHYETLLRRWNAAINLVSKGTLSDLWTRHFLDSAQLFHLAPRAGRWVDLGSGGGFPGLVIAALARDMAPDMEVWLVESDARKAAFLATVVRELSLNARVHTVRAEVLAPAGADVVSARALAPLAELCGFARRHLAPDGHALFLKGANHAEEIAAARQLWQFDCEVRPSLSDQSGVILRLERITHA